MNSCHSDFQKPKHKKKYKLIKRVPFDQIKHPTNCINSSISLCKNIFEQPEEEGDFLKKSKIDEGFGRFLKRLHRKKKSEDKEGINSRISNVHLQKEFQSAPHKRSHEKNKTVNFSFHYKNSMHTPKKEEEFYQKHREYTSKKLISIRSKPELISEKYLKSPNNKKKKLPTKHEQWVKTQNSLYQSKIGLISENFYEKPLVERYGSRYFQYILRNRYKDDIPPPPFIHRIEEDE